MATTEQWKDGLASYISNILNSLAALTARIEALEAQAAQPAQAEQEQGPERGQEAEPLVKRMDQAFYDNGGQDHDDWVAVMNAVADWLSHHDALALHPAAALLRAEAQATREGKRG